MLLHWSCKNGENSDSKSTGALDDLVRNSAFSCSWEMDCNPRVAVSSVYLLEQNKERGSWAVRHQKVRKTVALCAACWMLWDPQLSFNSLEFRRHWLLTLKKDLYQQCSVSVRGILKWCKHFSVIYSIKENSHFGLSKVWFLNSNFSFPIFSFSVEFPLNVGYEWLLCGCLLNSIVICLLSMKALKTYTFS